MRSTGTLLFYILALGVAGYAVVGYSVMPLGSLVHPEMKADFVAHPVAVYCHVFASAVALLLGPLQFSARLRRTRLRLHRWMGRVYLGVGVLVGGLSGLYLAAFAFGGPAARLGFAALALCWLFSGGRAFLAIRSGRIDEHRQWMVRNFSLAFAAITLRLYLPVALVAGVDFAVAYPVIAWLCWLPNLLAAEWLCKTTYQPLSQRSAGR
jgi:uncharacterized membrane protein